MKIGTGQRRPSNLVTRLDLNLQQAVADALLDGRTYGETRRLLTEAGVPEADLPRDSSFQAYMRGADYAAAKAARWQWEEETRLSRTVAAALNRGDGPRSAADVVVYQALQSLGKIVPETVADADRLSRAAATLQRAVLAAAEADRDQRLAELKAKYDKLLAAAAEALEQANAKIHDLEDEIGRLRGVIEAHGLSADGVKSGDGLTEATKERIRRIYGL